MKVVKTIREVFQQNILIRKGNSPLQLYKKDMIKQYVEHSLQATNKSLEAIYKILDNEKYMNDSVLSKIDLILYDNFNVLSKELTDKLATKTKALYYYKKPTIKGIQKGVVNVDKDTIKGLTQADIIWIKNHANNTQVARDIARLTQKLKLKELSQIEVAEILKETFDIPKNEYIKRYGELSYWQLVTGNQTARISNYSFIRTINGVGIEEYEWITQGSDACPICTPFHGKIFKVKDANNNIDDYMKASAKGSVDGMKKADKFLTVEDIENNPEGVTGQLPQLHNKCLCVIVAK